MIKHWNAWCFFLHFIRKLLTLYKIILYVLYVRYNVRYPCFSTLQHFYASKYVLQSLLNDIPVLVHTKPEIVNSILLRH